MDVVDDYQQTVSVYQRRNILLDFSFAIIYFGTKHKYWSCVDIFFGIISPSYENITCSEITWGDIKPFLISPADSTHIGNWYPHLKSFDTNSIKFVSLKIYMICSRLSKFIQEVHSVSIPQLSLPMGIWSSPKNTIWMFPKEDGGTTVFPMFSD